MILYDIGIRAMNLGIRLMAMRGGKARLLHRGRRDVWRHLQQHISPGESYVWVHAASLGEFEQGRPLIEMLRARAPHKKILLTFFSPSGYEVRKNYAGADVVAYLPPDTPGAVRRFLDLVHPEMAIFVKYEFWANYLRELHRRDIPTYLISAVFRPGQLFFRPYGGWYRRLLHCFTHIFVQDPGSRELLEGVGYRRVTVAGDTRFDRVSRIMRSASSQPLIESFLGTQPGFTLVVGSSWPRDEEIYLPWLARHPEVKAIIAPHEFDDDRLQRLLQRIGPRAILLSQLQQHPDTRADILIIDCFGILSSLYRYGDMAYIGGGFGAGIHNINEAAVYGIPVIYGPNNAKFVEARELQQCGGGCSISSRAEFEHTADLWLANTPLRLNAGEAASKYINGKLGATERVYRKIFG